MFAGSIHVLTLFLLKAEALTPEQRKAAANYIGEAALKKGIDILDAFHLEVSKKRSAKKKHAATRDLTGHNTAAATYPSVQRCDDAELQVKKQFCGEKEGLIENWLVELVDKCRSCWNFVASCSSCV
jgi:hypothetical protein